MKKVVVAALVLAVVGFAGTVQAADEPTGTWTWKVEVGGQTRDMTLKLKLDGGKLTGAMVGQNNQETAIADGKFKDGDISFTVTRERGGMKIVTKYTGKLTGDTIKGKAETDRNGQVQSRDWEAKRSKS